MAQQSVKGINPDLEAAISKMLKEVLNSPETSLIDKMRVIDRALNLEKIKQKVTDDAYGTGFLTDDADED
jgi:AraC-like DNA-binding protein